MTLLLFTGHKVPIKRYKNLLLKLEHRNLIVVLENQSDPLLDHEEESPVIVAHSLGILRALIYCKKHNVIPQKIISLDGSYLNEEYLKNHISPDDFVKDVIKEYLLARIKLPDYNVHLFRYIRNISEQQSEQERQINQKLNMLSMGDNEYVSITYYTDKVEHYPFDSKMLLSLIVQKI
jgi:esterase/lipase superfamily enzyme